MTAPGKMLRAGRYPGSRAPEPPLAGCLAPSVRRVSANLHAAAALSPYPVARGKASKCRFPQDISRGFCYVLTGCWGLSRLGSGGVKALRRGHLRVRQPITGFPTPAAGGFGPRRHLMPGKRRGKARTGNVLIGD
jgi:hypothetical protein